MERINNWWQSMSEERYWLGVMDDQRKHEELTAPCGHSSSAHARPEPLITHVKGGDVVFHYDQAQAALVSWSIARGHAHKRHAAADAQWVVGLEAVVALEPVVPLKEIASLQWEMFPALRAFEDRVGEPLYYPFAVDGPAQTHLLPGTVFKLPELFVAQVPALAVVAARCARKGERAKGRRRAVVAHSQPSEA